MYGFILSMWMKQKADAVFVQKCVPRWITQEQCDVILSTPQDLVATESIPTETV